MNDASVDLSIIIPAYNEEKRISRVTYFEIVEGKPQKGKKQESLCERETKPQKLTLLGKSNIHCTHCMYTTYACAKISLSARSR